MNLPPFPMRLGAVLVFTALALGPTTAHPLRRKPHAPARVPVAAAPEAAPQPPIDDLYRRRGTGIGGLVFGGGLGQAGACADLAFARAPRCGARGGYGPYGNGLDYGFGF